MNRRSTPSIRPLMNGIICALLLLAALVAIVAPAVRADEPPGQGMPVAGEEGSVEPIGGDDNRPVQPQDVPTSELPPPPPAPTERPADPQPTEVPPAPTSDVAPPPAPTSEPAPTNEPAPTSDVGTPPAPTNEPAPTSDVGAPPAPTNEPAPTSDVGAPPAPTNEPAPTSDVGAPPAPTNEPAPTDEPGQPPIRENPGPNTDDHDDSSRRPTPPSIVPGEQVPPPPLSDTGTQPLTQELPERVVVAEAPVVVPARVPEAEVAPAVQEPAAQEPAAQAPVTQAPLLLPTTGTGNEPPFGLLALTAGLVLALGVGALAATRRIG